MEVSKRYSKEFIKKLWKIGKNEKSYSISDFRKELNLN